jgi:hypothetical protein
MKAGESPIPWSKTKVLFGNLEDIIVLTQEFLNYMETQIPSSKVTASTVVGPLFVHFVCFLVFVTNSMRDSIRIKFEFVFF